MKRKFYMKIVFALLIMMLVTSCKSQEEARIENNSNAKEVSQENVDKEKDEKMEDKLFVEKENPRIVVMSVKAAKALKFLGYENVVAVPNGAESIYPDASSMREGLVLLDHGGRILSINPAAQALFHADGTCVGQNFLTVDRHPDLTAAIHDAAETGHSQLRAERRGREYQLDFSRIESNGKVLGTVLLAFDVTEQAEA